jgi:hypothetical protein
MTARTGQPGQDTRKEQLEEDNQFELDEQDIDQYVFCANTAEKCLQFLYLHRLKSFLKIFIGPDTSLKNTFVAHTRPDIY